MLITHFQATRISEFTTRGHVQVLKGLFTWLENEGYIDRNPIRRVKPPKTPRYVVRPLDEDEVRRLLVAPNPRRAAGSRDLATDALFVSFQGQALVAEGIRQVIRRIATRAGGDVFALQRILGHSTLSMTRNYVTLTDTDVKAAHLRASPADRLYRQPRR